MAILLGPGKPKADDADVFSVGGLQLFYVYMSICTDCVLPPISHGMSCGRLVGAPALRCSVPLPFPLENEQSWLVRSIFIFYKEIYIYIII